VIRTDALAENVDGKKNASINAIKIMPDLWISFLGEISPLKILNMEPKGQGINGKVPRILLEFFIKVFIW
jgi:hypothetical protein